MAFDYSPIKHVKLLQCSRFILCWRTPSQYSCSLLYLWAGYIRFKNGFQETFPVEDYLDLFDLAAYNIQKGLSGNSSEEHRALQLITGERIQYVWVKTIVSVHYAPEFLACFLRTFEVSNILIMNQITDALCFLFLYCQALLIFSGFPTSGCDLRSTCVLMWSAGGKYCSHYSRFSVV